jgi:hypothetical protein
MYQGCFAGTHRCVENPCFKILALLPEFTGNTVNFAYVVRLYHEVAKISVEMQLCIKYNDISHQFGKACGVILSYGKSKMGS